MLHAIARIAAFLLAAGLVFGGRAARAQTPSSAQNSICLMLESAALTHNLPVEFFARVIWRESRFDGAAIGPLTRSGSRAQGIAQFMPGTAADRGVLDPFDPIQALPKAAEYLRDLRDEFGNLGLAAAAYNAGPRRLREWLNGSGPMPDETRNYVRAVTGQPIEDWVATEKQYETRGGGFDCETLIARVKRTPDSYLGALEARVNSGASRPWNVQLAAGFSRTGALSKYAESVKRFSGLVEGRDPVISDAVLRSRGTRAFYRVSIGAESRSEANVICTGIRRAGGACMVLRNRGGPTDRARG